MKTTRLRGPYSIQELALITGMEIELLRQYQREGVIPKNRFWDDVPREVFYKVDVDRLLAEERRRGGLDGDEAAPQRELLRKIKRIINVQRRLYPDLGEEDVREVLRSVSLHFVQEVPEEVP